MSFWLQFILVFFATSVVDVCWTMYMIEIRKMRPTPAGIWGAGVYAAGAMTVLLYIQNHWLIIPAVIGSFFGTWATVKWEIRNEKKKVIDLTKSN